MSAHQNPAVTAEYERVTAEYIAPVQIAGLGVGLLDIVRDNSATPDAYRRALTRQLQHTLPRTVSASVRADASSAPAAEFTKTEQRVKAAVIEAAHESETLRPVLTRDRSGRECTEFFGKKTWMRPYQAPAMLAKTIGGEPVRLPVVL
ncbi:hypothetical protein NE850_23080 [Paraburkholderia sp. USG1]|uniref:hypothetical protein n=1 Tax=Paraburkholderia sp. USG1 TaxID=2952268 RepID=UPI002861F8FD|nr:hypothetical protein [Paraburkholderia sp. USG1]MDR8399209.1 hypothetical protein [Paraburkholderia sp. USG1]